ncbi:MAG: 30S ribosomal protein S15 [Candidatus Kapabacteria bacterium]|jgi:small subunit ribosomal protein S15|nr:30S ribosomal protein S15 [Candidatus Kapabacteria bacterium]
MISKERKQEIIQQHGGSAANTGKPEVQVALLTEHIQALSSHCEANPKDHHSRRGLIQLVSKRKNLLGYLAKNDIQRYRDIVAKLGLRK